MVNCPSLGAQLKFSPNHNFSKEYDYSSIQVVSDVPIVFYIEDEHNIIYALCTDNGNASMSSYYHIQDGLDGPSKFGVTDDVNSVNKYEVLDNFIHRMFYLPELLMDCSSNVMLFDSYDSARAYIDFGNENGWVNKPEVDITDTSHYDPAYYLIDFQANQSITAIWSGVSQRTYYTDIDVNEYINIHVGYAYDEAPGQIATVEKVPIN